MLNLRLTKHTVGKFWIYPTRFPYLQFSMWVMVGLHGGTFHLPLPLVPINGITIKGICYGDMDQLRHLTELVAAEKVQYF